MPPKKNNRIELRKLKSKTESKEIKLIASELIWLGEQIIEVRDICMKSLGGVDRLTKIAGKTQNSIAVSLDNMEKRLDRLETTLRKKGESNEIKG